MTCIIVCVSSAGFLIMLSPRRLCLSNQSQLVILAQCDITNPAQDWAWLDGARLIHTQSSRCLWADPGPRPLAHARPTALSNCSQAPAWSCYDTHGALGLAETRLYLKKQGSQLVIGGNVQASEWRKYDVDSEGNQLITSLCPEPSERGAGL